MKAMFWTISILAAALFGIGSFVNHLATLF
jgi:hypothetical protein